MARKSQIEKLNRIRPKNNTVDDVRKERDSGEAQLINFKNGTPVTMRWGMNQYTEADQIFSIRVGKEEAYLSVEDIQRFLRWV